MNPLFKPGQLIVKTTNSRYGDVDGIHGPVGICMVLEVKETEEDYDRVCYRLLSDEELNPADVDDPYWGATFIDRWYEEVK